ncbi:hypothetical protein ACQP2T_61160 [Nonomuraea sp. CA-143628]|uniref:hypothetical protein n=1 Tax=Nonomuraea sp. CA-143628 TaxID=3239997 RepID=UPI003D8EB35F
MLAASSMKHGGRTYRQDRSGGSSAGVGAVVVAEVAGKPAQERPVLGMGRPRNCASWG